MPTFYYHNALNGAIASYRASKGPGLTDFPSGMLLAYGDYLTTGLRTQAEANAWAQEWPACPTCKAARKGTVGEPCGLCQTPLCAPKM
jgi:hypothetical protein